MHISMPNLSRMISEKTKSFTLIELLIVVSIIGLLAAIAIPNFINASLKAEIAGTYARMKNAHTSIYDYMLDHQMFPPLNFVNNHLWPHAFSSLTTPINYLGSLDTCEDTFRKYSFDPKYNDILTPDHLEEKVYSTSYFMYDAKSVYDLYGHKNPDSEVSVLLASTGPDGWSQNIYSLIPCYDKMFQLNPFLIYSTTNGMRSCGDIISTNTKTYQ